jgi:polysaccharide export outer membrane protein
MKLLKRCLLVSAFATACFAQKESLLIGPGDKLNIDVFDTPEMGQTPRVTDAGTVPILFVGDVKVSGMTPAEAAKAIEDALISKQLMLHPQVSVTISEYAKQQVAVMGQVKVPGQYSITTPTPLIGVLALAGGLTDVADRHITVERGGGSGEKINYFLSNRSNEALDTDVMVNPGDTVLVPKAGIVYVLGDVGRPGGFPMTEDESKITVLQALALAGAINKTALLGKAKLVRQGATGPVDVPIELAAMEKGKQPDIQMQPGDILFIPTSWMKSLTANSSQIAASAASAAIYAHP